MRLAVLCMLGVAVPAKAFCPSYTASSSSNSGNCGVEASVGINPSTSQWQAIFTLVSQGPSAWGSSGPSVADLGQGCGKPMPSTSTRARFPCELLKALTFQESGWRQFCVPDRPADQVGGASRTIISFDCGYGIGQVTSGMHQGETPAFDRARVAGDATYNLATGTQILAAKWHATNCVGDNQPDLIEDWYLATWAYNGLSAVNNPNNPNYSTTRGVWNPSVGGSAPYQEKIFGWAEFPPSSEHWKAVALAYPKLSEIGASNAPPELSEPSCASPTSCVSSRAVHRSACLPGTGGGGGSGGGSAAGGGGSSGGAGGGEGDLDAGELLPDGGLRPGIHAQSGCGCQTVPNSLICLVILVIARRRRH